MARYKPEYRTKVARGWKPSGLTQKEYAAKHGISRRTLRMWIQNHAWVLNRSSGVLGGERAVAIVDDAIRRLQDLREQLMVDGRENELAINVRQDSGC